MRMRKHIATFAGLALALAFVAVFASGRYASKPFDQVANRIGLKPDEMMAMVPRIASLTGATTGTARRVVYLMACSGVTTRQNLEAQSILAAAIAEKNRVTPREATHSVLVAMPAPEGLATLRDC
jgi:hypothetical protein